MRINTNMAALNAWRNMTTNNTNLQKSLEKLSSGYRINRAADDAAGLAVSEKMRAQIRGLNMATRNAQDGISLVQTAEGALTETHSILQRMRELAVQASSETLDGAAGADLAKIQTEFTDLKAELTRIGGKTKFNGTPLLDGTLGVDIQIGADASDTLTITVGTAMDGTLVGAADLSSSTNASTAIGLIQTAIDTVSTTRAELGAKQNRLEHTVNSLQVTSENLSAAESRIRDVDMAAEMATFTKNNILMQASQSMLAQANQSTQGILNLLRG